MKTKDIVLCSLFAAMICISAIITIPLAFTPVPITLHVMIIFITGAVLGEKKGVITVGIYILIGFIGMPVFSGFRAGPGVLLGPTGGYIIGFFPAIYLIGFSVTKFIKHSNTNLQNYIICFFSMLIGLLVLYGFGTIQLMLISQINMMSALSAAVFPFIVFDIIKIFLAVPISIYMKQNINAIYAGQG